MEDVNNFQKQEEECQIIKPQINTLILLLQSLGIAIFMSFFLGGFLAGPLAFFVTLIFGTSGFLTVILGGLLFFVIILSVTFLIRRASLRKTQYKFYTNRVEYLEGFLVKNRKTINYDRISNIGQRKGIIEGWFGLGTIFIDTAGYSAKGHELSMTFLENPDKIYDWIAKTTSQKPVAAQPVAQPAPAAQPATKPLNPL